jgi:hypothetical protein
MPSYNLNGLGATEFERLAQALLKVVIGAGTITFGPGPDGGREATFNGRAPYPSKSEQWSGSWIFQAKFHDIERIGVDKARRTVLDDLDKELDKIVNKYKCDNYILLTNVPLTAAPKTGTIDKAENEIVSKYRPRVQNVHLWGVDELDRLLEVHTEVRTTFLQFITPGDVLAQLLAAEDRKQDEVTKTLRGYIQTVFHREQYAQLDQAGDVSDEPVRLQKVFFDLAAQISDDYGQAFRPSFVGVRRALRSPHGGSGKPTFHVVQLMLAEAANRAVLVGGPGEGKSTLGQYLAQLHRAVLLNRIEDVALSEHYVPLIPRLPLRVVLRDYGQWLARRLNGDPAAGVLDQYICEQIELVTGRSINVTELHDVVAKNPILLILDGLDEVTNVGLKKTLLDRLSEFTDRCDEVLGADMQILATTRPIGYVEQFDPRRYAHLRLVKLEPDQVRGYVRRWAAARELDDSKAGRLYESVDECLADPQIRLLTTTPLQVTILILIISSGGTPPRQREALFDDYLDVIYKRETAKGRHIIQSERELLIGLHKYVGYVLHEKATQAQAMSAVLLADDYEKHVERFLRYYDPYSPSKHHKTELRAITKEAGERLVLIVEPVPGEFGFELRSIQEFFAACHLVDTALGTEQRFDRFEAISRLIHWRNVALFFAGRIGRNSPGEVPNVIEVCRAVDRDGPDRYIRRGAELALELAADRAFGPNRVGQRSLLEHGLGILESDLTSHRLSKVAELVLRLPPEDIRDHVAPILRHKVQLLRAERLVDYAFIAFQLNMHDLASEVLQKMFRSASARSSCFRMLIRLDSRLLGAPSELLGMANALTDDEIVQSIRSSAVESAVVVIRDLMAAGMERERLRRLLAGCIRSFPGATPISDGRGKSFTEYVASLVDDSSEASALKSFGLLAAVRAFILRSQGLDRRGRTLNAVALELLSQMPRIVIDGNIPSCDPSDLTAIAIAAPQWILHMWFGEVSGESFARFISYYSAARTDSNVRAFISACRRSDLGPTLDLAVSLLDSMPTIPQDLVLLLPGFAGRRGLAVWHEALTELSEGISARVDRHRQPDPQRRFDELADVAFEENDSEMPYLLAEMGVVQLQGWSPTYQGDRVTVLRFIDDGVLTPLRFNAIERVIGLYESGDSDLRKPDSQLLPSVVSRLLGSPHPDVPAFLTKLLPFMIRRGIPRSDVDIDAVLRRMSGFVASPRTARTIARADDNFDSSTLKWLLDLVVFGEEGDIRSGSLTFLNQFLLRYRMNHRHRGQVPSLRFRGFADLHRRMVRSQDQELRNLGLNLFLIRPPSGRADFDLLRQAVPDEPTDVYWSVLWDLNRIWEQFDAVPTGWTLFVEELLDRGLPSDVSAWMAEDLDRLLSLEGQSLKSSEGRLSLPLAPRNG